MDMSKLPRLSQTNKSDAPTPVADDVPLGTVAGPSPNVPHYQAAPPEMTVGGEVWISVAVGAILLLMFPRLLQYIAHVLFGTFFAPFAMPDGTEVPYTATLSFWSDLGITAFAVLLIVEGLALAMARNRSIVLLAFTFTVATTAYNLGYVVLHIGERPIVSIFAVAFGVYIAMYQWKLAKATCRHSNDSAGA